MFKRTFVAGLLAVMLAPGAAFARPALPPEPQNFTLEVALATAMRNNPDIQEAEAKLEQAKIDKQVADLWWANAINANANYVMGNPYGYTPTATGTVLPTAAIGVGANLGAILAGPKNSDKAAAAVVVAQADLRRATLAVASQVTAAYQDYQAAKQLAGISPDTVTAAESDVRIAERQFAQGSAQVSALLGAKLAVAKAKSDSITQTGSVEKSWSNLLTLMGTSDWLPQTDNGQAQDGR